MELSGFELADLLTSGGGGGGGGGIARRVSLTLRRPDAVQWLLCQAQSAQE